MVSFFVFSPFYFGVPQRNRRSSVDNSETAVSDTESADPTKAESVENPINITHIARSALTEDWTFLEGETTTANSTTVATIPLTKGTTSNARNKTQRPEHILSRQQGFNPNMFDGQREGEATALLYDDYDYDYAYNKDDISENDNGDFDEELALNGEQVIGDQALAQNPEPVYLAQLLGK